MNRVTNARSKSKWMLGGLLLSILVITACNKNDDPMPATPAAGFMAFNLSMDQPAVGFSLSGSPLVNTAIAYQGFTGTYLPIFVGNREVRSYDFTNNATLATSNIMFADSMYYSAFLVGSNGNYENIVVEDDYDNVTPMSGKAWVRYVNAIPDTSVAPNISVGDMSNNAAYRTVSDFQAVDAGSLDLMVSNGTTVNASRTITVDENKIYTVLFTGLPNQTDTTKNVMIKFIVNGTATN